MVLDKRWSSCDAAVADIGSGARVMISGFGGAGVPLALVSALAATQARDLTVVANNAGSGNDGLASLFRTGQVSRIICSYPRSEGSVWFERRFSEGSVTLELVPQGTLSERIRAGGAGIAGFYTRTGVGTDFAAGKEYRDFAGEAWLLEEALRADFALVKVHRSDPWGNCVYRKTARNFGPAMATAASVTIVEADEVCELGALDPELVTTPGIFVDRVVVS